MVKRASIQNRILQRVEEIRERLSHFEKIVTGFAGIAQLNEQGGSVSAVLDALATHLTILDAAGVILYTNHAWKQFAMENGMVEDFDCIGVNYLHICHSATGEDAPLALEVAKGIESVIDKRIQEFGMEYPCHTSKQKRWFYMRVTRTVISQEPYVVVSHDNVTSIKSSYEIIREQKEQLRTSSDELEAANNALRVLLQRVEAEKREMHEKVVLNIQQSILPYVQKIKAMPLESSTRKYLTLMESSLVDIRSAFARDLTSRSAGLTPAEIRVASLIRNGLSTKEIAGMLNLSLRAIEFHRQNIRRKLGLRSRKANLHSFLLEMPSVALTPKHMPED